MDPIALKDRVKSPCQSICRLDKESRICAGCWRSIEEIATWIRLTNDEKKAAVLAADKRRADASPEFRAFMDQYRDADLSKRD